MIQQIDERKPNPFSHSVRSIHQQGQSELWHRRRPKLWAQTK